MKNLISQIIFVLILVVPVFCQNNNEPKLIDEFGPLNLDDTMARLDNLVNQTENTPNAKALIKVYGNNLISGKNPFHRADILEAYLLNMRKFPAEKLIVEICGTDEMDLRTELLVLPRNSTINKCITKLKTPQKPILFSSITFYFGEKNLSPFKEIIIAYEPTIGNYSKRTFQQVGELIKKSKDHKVYVITYLSTNIETVPEEKNGKTIEKEVRKLDKKSLAKKLLKNAKKELIKYKVSPSQINLISGGYVDNVRRLEFWFVPEGGEIPKPKPDYFPNKTR